MGADATGSDSGSSSSGYPVSPTFRRPTPATVKGEGAGQREPEQEAGREVFRSPTGVQRGVVGLVASVVRKLQGGDKRRKEAAPTVALSGASGVEEQQQQEGEEEQQPQQSSPSHSALTPVAAEEIFTHDEIVCLRLIFALWDDNGDDYVDEGELLRYAEETGALG